MLKNSKKRKNHINQSIDIKLKKKVKPNSESQNGKEKKNKLLEDEEILSEEADGIYKGENGSIGDENGDRDDDFEESKEIIETADQKRLRMAKDMIQRAKIAQSESIQHDEFFQSKGVYKDDDEEDDKVTKLLQLDHKKKTQGIFTNVAEKIHKELEAKDFEIEINAYKGHTKCITCIELDSSNQFVYSASKDGSMIKWDLNTGQKAILNLGPFDKTDRAVSKEILCMSLSYDDRYIVTGGSDSIVRLWDARDLNQIDTFKGHKESVLGIKFKNYSMEFCSAGADRLLKLWDAGEQAYIDTYYGHKAMINGIDAIGEHVITCGFDRQVIFWKTEDESQLIFKGGDYSIDSICALNPKSFVTGTQDGTINLWQTNKNKPVSEISKAHGDSWITSLGAHYNSDFILSGSYNDKLNAYRADLDKRKIEKLFELPSEGIINDIKISNNYKFMVTVESDEMRLGRWITKKAKNRIKLYRF